MCVCMCVNRTSGTHRVQNGVLGNHEQELQVTELYNKVL